MGSLPDSKYIIQTDGYWFVEAHDVDPSKGYISVSAKGIVNGLSNQPNDGCDFGPDSYNPSYSGSGVPYTQTSGIQEAVDYLVYYYQTHREDRVYLMKLLGGLWTLNNDINISIGTNNGSIIGIEIDGMGSSVTRLLISSGKGFNITVDNSGTYNRVSLNNMALAFPSNTTASSGLSIIDTDNNDVGGNIYLRNIDFSVYSDTNYPTNGGLYVRGGFILYLDNVTTGDPNGINISNQSSGGEPQVYFTNFNLGGTGNSQLSITNASIVNFINSFINGNIEISSCGRVSFIHCYLASADAFITGTSTTHMMIFDSCNIGLSSTSSYFIDYTGVSILYISFTNNTYDLPSTTQFISGGYRNLIWKNNSNISNVFSPLQPTGVTTTSTITPNPPVSGTAYQNTNPYDILIYLPVYTSTSGTAGNVKASIGASSSSLTQVVNDIVNSGTSSSNPRTIQIKVPAGWYYQFTGTTATFGTATVVAD